MNKTSKREKLNSEVNSKGGKNFHRIEDTERIYYTLKKLRKS